MPRRGTTIDLAIIRAWRDRNSRNRCRRRPHSERRTARPAPTDCLRRRPRGCRGEEGIPRAGGGSSSGIASPAGPAFFFLAGWLDGEATGPGGIGAIKDGVSSLCASLPLGSSSSAELGATTRARRLGGSCQEASCAVAAVEKTIPLASRAKANHKPVVTHRQPAWNRTVGKELSRPRAAGRFAKNELLCSWNCRPLHESFERKLMYESPYTLFRLQSIQSSIFSEAEMPISLMQIG